MRILDRYVATYFLMAAAVFLLTFLALFMLIDFVSNADLFFSLKGVSPVGFLLRYYALQLPVLLFYFLPAVTLFGAIFTLLRLSRNNEIVPVVTAGRSLRRLSAPFLAAAVLSGALVAVLEEFILPPVSEKVASMYERLHTEDKTWRILHYDNKGYHLYALEYNRRERVLWKVSLTRFVPPGKLVFVMNAEYGWWDPRKKAWVFTKGSIERRDESGNPVVDDSRGRPAVVEDPIPEEGVIPDVAFQPEDLRPASFLSLSFQTFADLSRKIREYPHVPDFHIRYHSKISFPLAPLVLLLLGFPFVVAAGHRGMVRGLMLCLLVALAYYGLLIAAANLGNNQALSPAAAAWAPTLLFGAAGAVLFARMKT